MSDGGDVELQQAAEQVRREQGEGETAEHPAPAAPVHDSHHKGRRHHEGGADVDDETLDRRRRPARIRSSRTDSLTKVPMTCVAATRPARRPLPRTWPATASPIADSTIQSLTLSWVTNADPIRQRSGCRSRLTRFVLSAANHASCCPSGRLASVVAATANVVV